METSLLILALLATPAGAEQCDDLWLSRNATLARAGQCFSTPLGESVFGRDCVGDASLAPRDAAAVARMRREELLAGCAVDTSRARPLAVEHLTLRLNMEDQPVADGLESSCVGYGGPAFPLRMGARDGAATVVSVPPGSDVAIAHLSPHDGWWFYSVSLPTGLQAAGWSDVDVFDEALCEATAG